MDEPTNKTNKIYFTQSNIGCVCWAFPGVALSAKKKFNIFNGRLKKKWVLIISKSVKLENVVQEVKQIAKVIIKGGEHIQIVFTNVVGVLCFFLLACLWLVFVDS